MKFVAYISPACFFSFSIFPFIYLKLFNISPSLSFFLSLSLPFYTALVFSLFSSLPRPLSRCVSLRVSTSLVLSYFLLFFLSLPAWPLLFLFTLTPSKLYLYREKMPNAIKTIRLFLLRIRFEV